MNIIDELLFKTAISLTSDGWENTLVMAAVFPIESYWTRYS